MNRRELTIGAATLAAANIAVGARAQSSTSSYPAKPIRMIVPYPAGGTTDVIARMLAQRLSDIWPQGVVVENRGGAAGVIGSDFVAKATPDGYTVLMGSGTTHSSGPAVKLKMPYNAITDFAPVSLVATFPNILLVNPEVKAKTVPEFIALLKENPGKYLFASSGVGGTLHLAAELFMMMSGTKMVHVPYAGPSAAVADLLSGRVQCEFDNMTSAWPLVQSGKLRALGVTGTRRVAVAPDLPTIAETLPGFEADSWVGLLMPAAVPAEIVQTFSAATRRIVGDAAFARKLQDLGSAAVADTPGEFAAFIKKDSERWRKVVKEAGIALQ